MNGNTCPNCQNSPWVQRANQFINNPSNPSEHVETVKYLLQNGHCGIDNRVSIATILEHLQKQGLRLTREQFQNNILTELKRQGIVATLIYPGTQGGVFILCNDEEVRKVALQVLDRITQELRNLEGIATQTQIEPIISILRGLSQLFKRLI